jgi:putative transcriptional regulator
MNRFARTLILVLFSQLGLASLSPAFAQRVGAPVLLAADPGLSGPYEGTVLLALPSGKGTHLGFILNRPTATRVSAIFPEVPAATKVVSPVFFGGPFMREAVFALVRSPLPPTEDSVQVLPGLYVAQGRDEAARVAERVPARSRFYAGLVVWERGELQSELDSGAWIVAEPDVEIVIGGSADTLWQRVLERVQSLVARALSPAQFFSR